MIVDINGKAIIIINNCIGFLFQLKFVLTMFHQNLRKPLKSVSSPKMVL